MDTDRRRLNINRFFAHLIVILMLFLLPEVIMGYAMSAGRADSGPHLHMYAKSLIYILVFYADYYIIIGRTLTPKVRVWKFIIYSLLALIGALGLCYLTSYYCFYLPRVIEGATRPIRHPEKFRLMFVSSMVRDSVMIILTMGLAVALKLSDHWAAMERRRRDMASEQRATELQNLKSQINPHFLFNTLNSIYALVEIAPAEAQKAVHKLSQMLRYMLYETPAHVTLKQETDFTLNYISLMELRLPEGRVETKVDITGRENVEVAPLLFIPLVENAFKHGNTGREGDTISIVISAKDGRIECATTNRFDARTVVDRQGGIGIANLRRRLLLIYGEKASLTTTIDGDTYRAHLTITTPGEEKKQ